MANVGAMENLFARHRAVLLAYARGLAGGLLFGLPLLYTMEMWWLGFSLPPHHLIIALVANFGLLLLLEHFSGFRENATFGDEVQDAIVALGLGLGVSVVMLGIINVLRPEMSLYEFAGKLTMQTIGVSIGISVATSMVGSADGEEEESQRRRENVGFWGNQGEAIAGAIFLALNIAATEEPIMIAMQMTPLHCLVLLMMTLALVFAITYALDFRGGIPRSEETHWWGIFFRDSVSTCATALMVSAGALMLFGDINFNTGLLAAVQMTVVLGFAASLGAAFARLLI